MVNLSKLKDIFISETEDHLQSLNDNALALEEIVKRQVKGEALSQATQDKLSNLLDELMRSAHTIKGAAAAMGYQKMSFLTHVLEDVFDAARVGKLTFSGEILNEVFKSLDLLEGSLESIKKEGQEQDVQKQTLVLKMISGLQTRAVKKVTTPEEERELRPSPQQAQGVKRAIKTVDHIKVSVVRLDKLMDLTEELLIDRMRLETIVDAMVKQHQKLAGRVRSPVEQMVLTDLCPASDHLSSLISDLQYHVMQSRMVPLEQVFVRFPRMVRDLAKTKQKDVHFEMEGEAQELDRTIIDKLAEPLVHLIRNAIDHGVQKKGTVKLIARQEKEFVKIMVEDDGGGVDWGAVILSSFKRKIINRATKDLFLRGLDKKNRGQAEIKIEVVNLLFHPLLSTKEKVTEISGRGVGLSAVEEFAREHGGSVHVESPLTPSGGSRFTLELPLTLAIINALLVKIRKEIFAAPFSGVERVVRVFPSAIKSMGDQDVAVIDKTRVPLVPLRKIFDLLDNNQREKERGDSPGKKSTKQIRKSKKKAAAAKIVVLVRRHKEIAGLVVDELVSEQEIIVKPLPSILQGVKGFSGSTILGTGKTILILDILSLLHDKRKFLRI